LEKGTQNAFEITNDESSKHMWSNPLLGPWNVGEEVCTKAFFFFSFLLSPMLSYIIQNLLGLISLEMFCLQFCKIPEIVF
jgi:hypothetical protein